MLLPRLTTYHTLENGRELMIHGVYVLLAIFYIKYGDD
jgi:hypothetical protein